MIHKIHLTDEELRSLALAVYLGNWVANTPGGPHGAPSDNEEASRPDIEALLQKLYRTAKLDGLPGLDVARQNGRYTSPQHDDPQGQWDDDQDDDDDGPTWQGNDADVRELIDAYDENAMFNRLAHELAGRDVHEQLVHGAEPPAEEDLANEEELEHAAFHRYLDEFDEHGLGRVLVDQRRHVPCEDDPK